MSRVQRIEEFFSPERFEAICEEHFSALAERIAFNIATRTSNSGARVNSLGLPAETTGATAASLRTETGRTGDGFYVAFVGRHGIHAIDDGSSPGEIREEFGSYGSFLADIERWARAKEARWALAPGSINARNVASRLWERGSVLYRDGGGTEQMRDLLPETVARIERQITEEIDNSIYRLIDASIDL